MWLKEIDNKLVPPPVNYIVGDLTILNFNLNEQAMLDNGWRDWTPEEIAAWEALHPVPEPPTPVVPYYTKSETDEQIAEAIGGIPPQVQSDWDQSDSTAVDYIKNKPIIPQPIPQVQANWDESDSEALSYIQNKPAIPAAQVQVDWDESDAESIEYIKNKPVIPEAPVQSNWDESDSANLSYIQNKPTIPEPIEQVQSNWDESDSSDAAYIQNKPDLSLYMPKTGGTFTGDIEVTGDIVASGDITSAGREILTPATTTIVPQDNKVYKHLLAASDVIAFDLTSLTSTHQVNFEVHLTQPSTAVTFTLPSGILWGDEFGDYDLSNSAPTISTPNTVYCLVFRWDGEVLMGNLTYTRASSSSGV